VVEQELERPEHEKEQANVFQRILDIPLIGDTIALVIGLFPPYFLAVYLLPNSDGDIQKVRANLLMSFLMFVWTAFLYFVLNIRLTLPLIPIPLFVIGLVGILFQLIRYLTI